MTSLLAFLLAAASAQDLSRAFMYGGLLVECSEQRFANEADGASCAAKREYQERILEQGAALSGDMGELYRAYARRNDGPEQLRSFYQAQRVASRRLVGLLEMKQAAQADERLTPADRGFVIGDLDRIGVQASDSQDDMLSGTYPILPEDAAAPGGAPRPPPQGPEGREPAPPPTAREREQGGAVLREAEREAEGRGEDSAPLFSSFGRDYLRLGLPEDAERALTRAAELEPASPEPLALRSAARLERGDERGALRDAREALRREPGHKVARAVETYLMASAAGAPPPPRAALRALAGAGPGGPAGAALPGARPTALRGGASARPKSPADAKEAEARRKLAIGDSRGALLAASQAIEKDPKSSTAWSARSAVLNKLGDHSAAARDATEAIRLDPLNAEAFRERSQANYQLGDYRAALADAEEAVRLDPRNALGYLYRAMAKEKLGDVAGALADYETAARLDPGLRTFWEDAKARLEGPPPPARGPAWARLAAPLGLLAAAGGLLLFGLGRGRRAGSPPLSESPEPSPPLSQPAPRLLGLAPGATVAGTIRIERELGRGGMGVVYEGLDSTLLRKVAVKVLRRDLHDGSRGLDPFLKEARLMASLKHPNLAQIHAAGEEAGEVYLVIEHVDGRDLAALLAEKGRLGVEEALKVLEQVCSALAYTHSRKVIHRDLKPSNVMVERDGHVKVLDFGIAHQAATTGLTTTAPWGTPLYMAPEQGMGRVSRASDLYALGAVAYELLAGEPAFHNGSSLMEDKLHKRWAPPSRRGLPPALDAFFDKALAPKADERFQDAESFLAAFRRALSPASAG